MKYFVIPEYVLSQERLDTLLAILLEKESVLSSVKTKDFGPRVTEPESAKHLLSKISKCTRKVLGLSAEELPEPDLTLRHNLSQLSNHLLKGYLFFVPLCTLLAVATAAQEFTSTIAYYLVFTVLAFLLLIPLLVHRRTRLYLEHQCKYVRTGIGNGNIVVDELHSVQLQSYLAHEYGHHLFFCLYGEPTDPWVKEGWARLVQWRVVSELAEKEGNPAFLHHALFQIVSELKFACTLLARLHYRRLPRKIQRIPTLYHFNPFYRLITGTPGFHMGKLLKHSFGTAVFFLECTERSSEEVLADPPYTTAHEPRERVSL
jgi:hypothetical protein